MANGTNKKTTAWIMAILIPIAVFFMQEWRHAEAKGMSFGTLKTTVDNNTTKLEHVENDIAGIESALKENRDSWQKIETFMGRIDERIKGMEKSLER